MLCMDEKDIVAQNLVYFRKKAGLSQLELSQKLQYSNKNISKWENGETTPNVFTLNKLSKLYNITIDDLFISHEKVEDEPNQKELTKKLKRKRIGQYAMLLMANAILFSVACVGILILSLLNVTSFNKWLLLLFIQPLDLLSLFIFIRCIYKHIDIISLSLFGWVTVLCFYLVFIRVPNIEMIFILGAAYQFLIICITLIINLKLVDKFANRVKILKEKRKKSKSKQ